MIPGSPRDQVVPPDGYGFGSVGFKRASLLLRGTLNHIVTKNDPPT